MDIGKKISMTQDEAAKLKTLAKEGVTSRPKIIDLTRSLKQEKQASAEQQEQSSGDSGQIQTGDMEEIQIEEINLQEQP